MEREGGGGFWGGIKEAWPRLNYFERFEYVVSLIVMVLISLEVRCPEGLLPKEICKPDNSQRDKKRYDKTYIWPFHFLPRICTFEFKK